MGTVYHGEHHGPDRRLEDHCQEQRKYLISVHCVSSMMFLNEIPFFSRHSSNISHLALESGTLLRKKSPKSLDQRLTKYY